MSLSNLTPEQLIQAGHDTLAFKYYATAVGTILFYDYLLTLADEIKYAWSGRKSWTFWLFLTNRYLPMTWQFWIVAASFVPHSNTKFCDKTSWYSLFMFVVCTLLAQIVLTLRVYAVTNKNIPTAVVFVVITTSQLGLGIVLIVQAAVSGVEQYPPIPLDAFHLCIFARHKAVEVTYTGISLLFDSLAFTVTILLTIRSANRGLKIPSILRTIARDATIYFFVIFTSHLVLEITLNLKRASVQVLPGPGILVYLPVMISRLMLSLRKAVASQQNQWSFGVPTTIGTVSQPIKFSVPQKGRNLGRSDDMPLDTFRTQDDPW